MTCMTFRFQPTMWPNQREQINLRLVAMSATASGTPPLFLCRGSATLTLRLFLTHPAAHRGSALPRLRFRPYRKLHLLLRFRGRQTRTNSPLLLILNKRLLHRRSSEVVGALQRLPTNLIHLDVGPVDPASSYLNHHRSWNRAEAPDALEGALQLRWNALLRIPIDRIRDRGVRLQMRQSSQDAASGFRQT